MVYDQPLYHQNTHMNITFLVVDDDPISLSIIPNMLKTMAYKDKSYRKIKVMTAKNSSEAVSTLRGHSNNIDVVITDYHIPGLNGVQLKKMINKEFGNLPVIVISAHNNKKIEQEVLASGAKGFVKKPITPDDLKFIRKYAIEHKMSDPENIKADDLNRMENSTNNSDDDNSQQVTTKKPKLKWTSALQHKFVLAIKHIGFHKATPKKILKFMKVEGLTRAHIASHLQKYRNHMEKIKQSAMELQISTRTSISNLASSSHMNLEYPYNYNTILPENNLFNSQVGYGIGQTSLTMNNNDNIPYTNYIPSYSSSETNSILLPTENSQRFSSGMLPTESMFRVSSGILPFNEERISTFETSQAPQAPQVSEMAQVTQAPQVPRFGQYNITNDALGMNSNLSTGYISSGYAGIRLNENGDLVGHGGIRVNGYCNGPLGEILDAMNWNFNDNNNMNNCGSSNPMFPPALPSFLDNEYQLQNNLTAQIDGIVPVLDNPILYDHHHGINEVLPDTINFQYEQNQQHHVNVTGENIGLSNHIDRLEMNEIPVGYLFDDIGNLGFVNLEDISNVAASSEMYVPTHDMTNISQEQDDAEIRELLSTFGRDWEERGVLW